MERNEIIILGALAAAFFILRPRATTAGGAGQGAATGAGGAAAAPAAQANGPLSWELGDPQTSESEARWPYSYLTPNSTGTSPTQDPVQAAGSGTAFTPMPKIPLEFA